MKKTKGFTLTEMLIYISVSSIAILAIASFVLWVNRSNTKIKVLKEVLNNSKSAIETMSYEIKHAKSIYIPTSIFSTHPGQLSLETPSYAQKDEYISYIDFFICEQSLCLKKENQDPIILTSDKVQVKNLEFNQVDTSSVQINLKIDYLAPSDKPEYQASINTTSTVSIRIY